jgi:SpoVK/Ycf46/Vps4 family AAA+-type ATPase
MVRSLGPIILIIDEGDRAFGGRESDGGTSSRVIARIKEFMSDPDNRGRVIFIVMTNRPDKLDVDMKRAGRLDRKIPFFYADEPALVESVVDALFRRHGVETDIKWARDRDQTSAKLVGYSNADLEAVCLLANDMAGTDKSKVTAKILAAAVVDYMPSKDAEMLEYMELLAVFETSRRSMLPQRFRDMTNEELNDGLRKQRLKLRL